jgi:NAD(P)-dependent dehydrogenase (short-subunit alcohol dehydrogenase family)
MAEILVIGARPGSVGAAVRDRLNNGAIHFVTTAGIAGEDLEMDVRSSLEIKRVIQDRPWDHVIYTAGINEETLLGQPLGVAPSMDKTWEVNALAPMVVLDYWLKAWEDIEVVQGVAPAGFHFVVISSNSAVVPRSKSIGYCASKAALSQAVRCAARAVPEQVVVWGIEPGWIHGTPMSAEVVKRLDPANDVMRGGAPTDRRDIASLIEWGIEAHFPKALNGMMFRLDGGEQ